MTKNNNVCYNSQTAIVNLPHSRYIDKVLRSDSFEELWWRFKDADYPSKEISESYAVFSNMKKVCIINNFNWLHIGDGGYTRTAAVFAFFSKTLNISIDPMINVNKFFDWSTTYDVKNIMIEQCKFENLTEENLLRFINETSVHRNDVKGNFQNKPYNIALVHAHVKLDEVDKQFPNWKFLYTNPCCMPQTQIFTKKHMRENNIIEIVNKLDLGISSHQRNVVIYKKLKPE